MSEVKIFGQGFMEVYADSEQMMALVEDVETKLQALMEQHGVSSWEELPEDVLESFEVSIPALIKGEDMPNE